MAATYPGAEDEIDVAPQGVEYAFFFRSSSLWNISAVDYLVFESKKQMP